MINKVKERLKQYQNIQMIFRYNGSRNQIEEFIGYIENLYSNVFTIKLNDSQKLKSFSYNDVLIHKLVFKSV